MKILFFGLEKMKFMPYINFYLDNIDKSKNDVHVITWNRNLKDEDLSAYSDITFHEVKHYLSLTKTKLQKYWGYYKLRKLALKIIRKNKFDMIVSLHTMPGVIISGKIHRKFKNKFIFDYRDLTKENKSKLYKKIVRRNVVDSLCTFVSSDGFRKVLPESETYKIFTSHNILVDSLNHSKDKEMFNVPSKKIRISFWGILRNNELNFSLAEKIGADDRFELHYYGREEKTILLLKDFVKEKSIKNVFFHGEYVPTDRYKFITETDIIHNVYYDENMVMAMSNKYYDGVIFRLPQLCCKDTFMGKMVAKEKVGLVIDPLEENLTQKIFDYYTSLNQNEFNNNCQIAQERFLKEYYDGAEKVKEIFNK